MVKGGVFNFRILCMEAVKEKDEQEAKKPKTIQIFEIISGRYLLGICH
jgi:hypothetical protein